MATLTNNLHLKSCPSGASGSDTESYDVPKKKVNTPLYILVTMDVKSLYTNIPNDEGIQAVKDYISKSDVNKMKPVITAFPRLILTLNNFSFDDASYLQVSGVSMGHEMCSSLCKFIYG